MTPAEAARAMVARCAPLPAERRPLRDALDRVLAEDVVSPIDLPPWDNSAMDGYATRSADLQGSEGTTPIELDVIETVPAGATPIRPLGPGQATRIFTGAPLPSGADGVIRQEDTDAASPGRVTIRKARDAGRNVRRRGEDIRKGATVLAAGTPLGPAQLGVLASVAHGEPLVHRRPRVAFLGSGDEIVDLDHAAEILAGRKIATSNSYTLHAAIRRAGAEPVELGIARDTPESLRALFERAARAEADLLITTAGISVGEHDLVRDVIRALGGTLDFWRIAMRPGAPVGFGMVHGRPWLGLPGNPVSTLVTFELFARPLIRRMLGHTLLFRRTVPVTVAETITLGPPLRHYLRAVVEPDGGNAGGLVARLTGPQGSGILTSMTRANALLIVPADRSQVPAGATLTALGLDDPHHVAEPVY